MANNKAKEKSKEKLGRAIQDEITTLFEKTLDFAQVACPESNYKALRSKILRVGNNCIRNLKKELDHYDIEYTATAEDVVEVPQK